MALYLVCEKEEVEEIYNQLNKIPSKNEYSRSFTSEELSRNEISNTERELIKLLVGDWKSVILKCKKDKNYLGWSTSMKDICVYFTLLLLDQNDLDSKAKARIYNSVKHQIAARYDGETLPDFESLVNNWKEKKTLDEQKNILEFIEDEVDARLEVLIGGGYRNSYYKGAELLVYLGQVLESYGDKNATARLVEKYKKIH